MKPRLQLRRGQEQLTPEQRAEVERFAEACIQTRLSTEPVDEREAEALLCQAYQVRGLPVPERIHWVDGPLQLVMLIAPPRSGAGSEASFKASILASIQDTIDTSHLGIDHDPYWSLGGQVISDGAWLRIIAGIEASVRNSVGEHIWEHVQNTVGAKIDHTLDSLVEGISGLVEVSIPWADHWKPRSDFAIASTQAFFEAPELAVYHFFATYQAPNALHAFAHFNELVSGYWLSKEVALLVRRPCLLSLDDEGRLHHATGKALAYADGWDCYAWHGVLVPEKVILEPETLTRGDFLNETNVETRRAIQECMGDRFVPELGGVVLDAGPHGMLYEVELPDDPERVARYVQVQDSSTERQYFLRVPPTIQTAAEAIAWSFGLSVEEYGPAQET